ncbi:hypothetical protein ABL78_1027 [Leptomonas seymouri]|uniref:Frag1/DRAM/Sfk1 family protein n=1 Tax=Leptomonas seymouri TaxID=5684 RepID=A0A0N1IB70_LEPSE|nr:hypothetical protein ABL78_1027 [Leptomonas seymouri]|eukprot:KPI89858.1 hypothetical protein ABL78_1027 [Leptomonas seymouri]
MRHIFYVPASYAALIYAFITGTGLLSCLYIGLAMHSKEILTTACGEDHYEFWPSISSTIGDMMPERQTWRLAFVLCTPFRLGATISLFNVFWQKSSRGMADLYSFRASVKTFVSSNAFLALLVLWMDLWRLVGACIWTMVASYESLPYHNLGFCPYIFVCIALQAAVTTMVRRSRYNMSIYRSQQDASRSLWIKTLCLWGESIASLGVVCCYAYHFTTCANGSFSMSNMFEWLFAACNIIFDASAWYDTQQEGWWLSATPGFYRKRWGHRGNLRASSPPAGTNSNKSDGGGAAVVAAEVDDSIGKMQGFEQEAENVVIVSISTGSPVNTVASPERDGIDKAPATEEGALLSSSPRTTTGEFFLDQDIILHRLTFCSAPSRLTLWLCDIYWAHLFFEMVVHLVQHMYFMPLIAMSLSWEVCSLLVIGVPCLLRISRFRRWATGPCPFARTWLKPSHVPIGMSYRVVPMYVFFYAMSCLSHLHQLVLNDPGKKILVVATGPLFLYLGVFTRFLYPSTAMLKRSWTEGNEDSRRLNMATPLGLVLCMLLRILHVSVSPLYTSPFYGSIFGIVLGLSFTTVIYRHAMFGNALRVEQNVQRNGVGAAGTPSVTPVVTVGNVPLMRASPRDGEGDDDKLFVTDDGDRDSLEDGRTRGVHFSLSQADEVTENTVAVISTLYGAPPPLLLGILFGCMSGIAVTFFNSAHYIPRLLAVDPYPTNFIIVAIFTLGVFYSIDVLPISLVLLRPKRRPDAVRRAIHAVFRGSWARFGVLLAVSTCLMLFASRQTNFTYELPHPGYPTTESSPRENVDIKHWAAQEDFWGSKTLALLGGFGFTFCAGVLFPFVMEVTWAHQSHRRFAQIAEAVDADAVISRECTLFTSFEVGWVIVVISVCTLYALCISYPFVPMAWVMRERSRSLILAHVAITYGTAYIVARRIRGSRAVASALTDVKAARKQRSMQLMVALLVAFAFVWVFFGYISMGSNAGFPKNKKTAIEHQDEVLHIHKMLVELRKERNDMTDPLAKEFERAYYTKRYEDAMSHMWKNISDTNRTAIVDPKFHLSKLSVEDRIDVWNAAQAMTFFSGAIFTVHFGLDNFNVDSLSRIVEQLRRTEAGVIGLLESDSMHLTNGNRDLVDYVSYHLGFPYTDYGPTALDNTYGCALITRYPILRVRRYVIPSPLGELACTIHAVLDVYGIQVHTYVGHFGNTEHWADGLLQSQFIGRLVQNNPGPSMWLGYLVTPPGKKDHYAMYTDPTALGKFRDAGLQMYRDHPWVRLSERGGYEEEPPSTVTKQPDENTDFNVEYKLQFIGYLEEGMEVEHRFRRPPPDKPPRYFYYNDTHRYTVAHPRFEFVDRYCQYILYKTGAKADERPEDAGKLQKYQLRLFDWWRVIDHGVELLSDTEIQVVQLAFEKQSA